MKELNSLPTELNILQMGTPGLREVSKKVTESSFGSEQLKKLVEVMLDAMNEYQGIGIAAPQIGVNVQCALIHVDPNNPRYQIEGQQTDAPLVIINPEIKVIDPALQYFWEGCLSVAGLRGLVGRPSTIQVNYFDLEGNKQSLTVTGFEATVFQHELDHLKGILYIDRLRSTKDLVFEEEFDQYIASPSDE